jgi:hypothetical protein
MITQIIKIQIHTLLTELSRRDPANREYIDLKSSNHTTNKLKHLLNKINFFAFNTSNSGEYRVGVSQIVAYLSCGGYKVHNETNLTINKETYNVHHLSGDVTDNSSSNLVYLSTDDHKLVTEIQNGYLDVSAWEPEETAGIKTQFNRQGRPIQNHTAFLKTVVAKTIMMTARFLERVATGKTRVKSIKAVQEWVAKTIGKVFQYTGLLYIAEELKPIKLTPDQAALTGFDIIKTFVTMAVMKRTEPVTIAIATTDDYIKPSLPF